VARSVRGLAFGITLITGWGIGRRMTYHLTYPCREGCRLNELTRRLLYSAFTDVAYSPCWPAFALQRMLLTLLPY